VQNNPMNFADPTGFYSFELTIQTGQGPQQVQVTIPDMQVSYAPTMPSPQQMADMSNAASNQAGQGVQEQHAGQNGDLTNQASARAMEQAQAQNIQNLDAQRARDAAFTHPDSTPAADPMRGVLRDLPGQPQYLPRPVVNLIQPVFDELAEKNHYTLDISKVQFVITDLGAAYGKTERDTILISPKELDAKGENQFYLITHELTHVLQFEVSPGDSADARWSYMQNRYASESEREGRRDQYRQGMQDVSWRLDVLDNRFTLESIAVKIGAEGQGRYWDR
jgi:hypothetical protein